MSIIVKEARQFKEVDFMETVRMCSGRLMDSDRQADRRARMPSFAPFVPMSVYRYGLAENTLGRSMDGWMDGWMDSTNKWPATRVGSPSGG